MNQSIITKIKNGKITLPKGLQKEWGTDKVMFLSGPDGLYIKPITNPSLSILAKKMSKAAAKAGITPKDVTDAVAWARKKHYANRT